MQIEILSVSKPEQVPSKTGGVGYSTLEVAYKRDGKVEGKKLVSFTFPEVFKALRGCEQGDILEVSSEKNPKTGYWDWQEVRKLGPEEDTKKDPEQEKVPPKAEKKWVPDELRQKYIIRQSSISSAVALVGSGGSIRDVLTAARAFEAYVFEELNAAESQSIEVDMVSPASSNQQKTRGRPKKVVEVSPTEID